MYRPRVWDVCSGSVSDIPLDVADVWNRAGSNLGLHAAVDATVRSPDVAARFTDLGADAQFGTPSEFAAYVADDLAQWARLAKEAGLKAE